jgi:dihydropteroate synthase
MPEAAVGTSSPSVGSPPSTEGARRRIWPLARGRELTLGSPPLVMGIVNITPDSFSDGGKWLAPDAAIEHGLAMVGAGADLLDLGAESTRPGGGVYGSGAAAISAEDELARLLPVISGLRRRTEIAISVDTRKAAVAAAALDAGADLINDVSGLGDPAMAGIAAERACPIVLMHSRGEFSRMQRGIHFANLLAEVAAELLAAADQAVAAGVARDLVALDPGIGFGKRLDHNLTLLRHLDRLRAAGYPLLVGASRKSFIGEVTAAAVDERLPGSLAAAAWSAHHRVAIVRVHDVAATRQFLDVWSAIDSAEARP